MKIGKLTNEQLSKIILNKLHMSRKEVLVGSGVGVDCAVLDLGAEYCVLSTDPITAAERGAGTLAVHISANDIAAAGAEPFAMLVTILLPPEGDLQQLESLMQEIEKEAEKLDIDIVGGHTEVTDAVNKAVISVVAIGETRRVLRYGDIRPGDELVLTKSCGIEGALILYKDHQEFWDKRLSDSQKEQLSRMKQMLSVLEEARIAKDMGAAAMHDVTEGGVFGAAYEMAQAANLGLTLNTDCIPVNEIALEMAKYYQLDPFRLISSGSLLIAVHGQAEPMLAALQKQGICAHRIGKFTKDGIIYAEGIGQISPPAQDELFKVK